MLIVKSNFLKIVNILRILSQNLAIFWAIDVS